MENRNIFEISAEALNNIQNSSEVDFIIEMSDYSDKYGIGYLFNNYNIGVIFRDYTKIIFKKDLDYFYYIDNGDDNQIVNINKCEKLLNDNVYSVDKKIKYKIFISFYKYFTKNRSENYTKNIFKSQTESVSSYNQITFVKKYIIDKYSYVFIFNNSNIQAIFQDNSTILFDINKKYYYYYGSDHKFIERASYDSKDFIKSEEFKRRFNYLHTVIHNIRKKHNQ